MSRHIRPRRRKRVWTAFIAPLVSVAESRMQPRTRSPDDRFGQRALTRRRPGRSSHAARARNMPPRTTPTASDMATASRNALSVLFLELNEAERYWIDKLSAEGKLPVFRRLLEGGVCLRTSIPDF